jgi:hypothetical protein
MHTHTNELQRSLDDLSTDRLQQLAARLETGPSSPVALGDWEGCPMQLAGFDADNTAADAPERAFATIWDAYAWSGLGWRDLLSAKRRRVANQASVQQLLQMTNTTLARRAAGDATPRLDPDSELTPSGAA